jgi:Zn finger protein HypA/HybF involved in hydrogenase expression
MAARMSDLDIIIRENKQAFEAWRLERELAEQGAFDPEFCPNCGSNNYELIEAGEFECFECGQLHSEEMRGARS